MAKPIKETPILKGKDAEKFEKALKEAETRKVSAEDYQRAQEAYNKLSESSKRFV